MLVSRLSELTEIVVSERQTLCAGVLGREAFRETLFRSFADEYNEPFDFSADGLDFNEFHARFFNKLARPSN